MEPTIWVSSIFHAVGSGPKLPWFQVVSWGRNGPALRPILTLSLCQKNALAELDGVTWPLSLRFQSSIVESSLKSLTVSRSICCLPYEPQIHIFSFMIGPPTSAP